MNTIKKSAVITVIAALFLVLPLPLDAQESNTSIATAGLFGNDVDDYMSYHYWSDVLSEENKWFGFAGWNWTNAGRPSIGFAKHLGKSENGGGAYLGVWFNGNIINIPDSNYTQTITPTYDLITGTKTNQVTTTTYPDTLTTANNELAVLLGIGEMGIKAGVAQNLSVNKFKAATQFTVTDNQNGWKTYQGETLEYANNSFSHTPYIGWGGNFGSFKPYIEAGVELAANRYINTTSTYNKDGGNKTGRETINHAAGHNEGYILPDITLGFSLDLARGEESLWDKSLGVEYNGNYYFYNNDYSASGIKGTAKGTASWADQNETIDRYLDRTETVITQTVTIEEIVDTSHSLTPSFTVTGEPAEGLKLGFYAGLPVSFGFKTADSRTETWIKSETKYISGANSHMDYSHTSKDTAYDPLEKDTELSIKAEFAIGVSYQLAPDRFSIHAGVTTSPIGYLRVTTTSSPNNKTDVTKETETLGGVTILDTETPDTSSIYGPDSKTTDASWSAFSYGARGGFTFNFGEKAAVDMAITTNTGVTDGNLNLTAVNVLFMFKF